MVGAVKHNILPELTEEQEAGLEAALASVQAGQGLSRDEAYAKAKANLE